MCFFYLNFATFAKSIFLKRPKKHSLHDAGTVRADDMLPFQEIPKLQISKSSFFFFEKEIT
jgi:hypothetical protein